jgi:hypothetical protein
VPGRTCYHRTIAAGCGEKHCANPGHTSAVSTCSTKLKGSFPEQSIHTDTTTTTTTTTTTNHLDDDDDNDDDENDGSDSDAEVKRHDGTVVRRRRERISQIGEHFLGPFSSLVARCPLVCAFQYPC